MQTTAPLPTASPRSSPAWLKFFAPAPVAPVTLTDRVGIEASFRSWRARVLFASTLGYAVFYFVRSNLDIAMPFLEKDLGISKKSLGIFLTLHGVIYGLSKFANGFLGDRCNARALMSTGLLLSAIINILFGFSSTAVIFGILWMINGLFQGMGSRAWVFHPARACSPIGSRQRSCRRRCPFGTPRIVSAQA
jgi:OPA family glycerol-3-phosphate transporter-like MFS transporter/OPA family sugar phosphate sensor protein UhpC-like MFS transporter